jgi:hypothetical protein
LEVVVVVRMEQVQVQEHMLAVEEEEEEEEGEVEEEVVGEEELGHKRGKDSFQVYTSHRFHMRQNNIVVS